MSSFTPHQSQSIRWHVIADHFLLAFSDPHTDRLDFAIRHTSRQSQRQHDLAGLAYELASCIAERGERIRATFPKPNASAETWREAGVVDGDLFPDAFLDRLEGLNGPRPSVEPNAHCFKSTWYRRLSPDIDRAAIALVVNALAEYPETGRYLPSLAFLAQQPRVSLTDMGFHYGLPLCAPTTLFMRQSGLTSYIDITISNYILLNILLTLDSNFHSGSPLLRDTSFPNPSTLWELPLPRSHDINRDDYPDFTEPLHHSFWTAFSDEHGLEASFISVYMDRCLSFLAGWYAIMTESTVKARALKYYSPTDFSVKHLAAIIILRLGAISLAFDPPSFDTQNPVGLMEKWMSELPPPIDFDPTPAPAASDASNEVERGTSTFMLLPRELRHHIFTFLPLPLVVPLASLCRELHETCTDLIYARPISALQVHRIEALEHNPTNPLRERALRLEKLLAARPDLCARLRSFNLSAFDAMAAGGNVRRRDAQIFLCKPVVRSMRGLSNIKLFLPFPSCGICEADLVADAIPCGQLLHSVLRVLIGQWPHLHSLTIGHLEQSVFSHPNYDFRKDIDPSLSIESVPDADLRWNLSELTIQRPRAIDWRTGREYTMTQHVPLRLLIDTSVHTLRYLSISSSSPELADVESFPVCPVVTNLAIHSELKGGVVTRLLARCFPVVKFLKVSYNDAELERDPEDDATSNFGYIDYPRCVPMLEELSYHLYSVKALPSSTKTVILNNDWEPVEEEIYTFENVEAVYLCASFKEDEQIQRLSLSFPNICSLEVPITPYREQDMAHLADSLAKYLPHLKQFVVDISDFTRAGRRLDYPVDDDMEPVQQECAVMFFKTCPALEILSFNGIPDDWEYECRFPSRVWVKTEEDGVVGARMAGRSVLRWKVSEDGNHRVGSYF